MNSGGTQQGQWEDRRVTAELGMGGQDRSLSKLAGGGLSSFPVQMTSVSAWSGGKDLGICYQLEALPAFLLPDTGLLRRSLDSSETSLRPPAKGRGPCFRQPGPGRWCSFFILPPAPISPGYEAQQWVQLEV